MKQMKDLRRFLGVAAIAAAIGGTSAFAEPSPQSWTDLWRTEADGRTQTVSGTIENVRRGSRYVTLELTNGYEVLVPSNARTAAGSNGDYRARELDRGDVIRAYGRVDGERRIVTDSVELLRDRYDERYDDDGYDERYGRSVSTITGTVADVDRTRDIVTLRTSRGALVRADAGDARGVDADRLREGERVTVTGTMRNGYFDAARIDRGWHRGAARTTTQADLDRYRTSRDVERYEARGKERSAAAKAKKGGKAKKQKKSKRY